MSAPLCKDCKYFWGGIGGGQIYCDRPKRERYDLVNGGWLDPLGAIPHFERRPGRAWFGLGHERCGPHGKFFERREVAPQPRGGTGIKPARPVR